MPLSIVLTGGEQAFDDKGKSILDSNHNLVHMGHVAVITDVTGKDPIIDKLTGKPQIDPQTKQTLYSTYAVTFANSNSPCSSCIWTYDTTKHSWNGVWDGY
jgi:hypothetical protein